MFIINVCLHDGQTYTVQPAENGATLDVIEHNGVELKGRNAILDGDLIPGQKLRWWEYDGTASGTQRMESNSHVAGIEIRDITC
jgi:hypothetical protein